MLDSKNIKVTGWKDRKQVLELLNNNDIFILTSLWEGLPISILEAMFMEKICIVSNCIGNKDVIENSKNGFIANSKEDFIKIVESIKNNEYNLDSIKQNAYKDLEEKYNIKLMVKKYLKEYGEDKI